MGDERSSGSNAGVVIVIALLVLALPCCGGVALLGLGVFSLRSVSRPAAPPPPTMQAPPPIFQDEIKLEPIQEMPLEPAAPAPADSLLPEAPPGESPE
jgi:hypothetical protein